MPDNNLTLTIRGNNRQVLESLRQTSESFGSMTKTIKTDADTLIGRLEKLNEIRLTGLIEAAKGAGGAIQGLRDIVKAAGDELFGFTRVASDVGSSLRGVTKRTDEANASLSSMAPNAIAAGDALGDVGAGAGLATDGLKAVQGEAKTASNSLGGLGRSAGGAAAKIEALNTTTFDPAGIVASADAATMALRGTASAAVSARSSVAAAAGGGSIAGGRTGRRVPALVRAAGSGARLFESAAVGITGLAAGSAYADAKFDNTMQGVIGNTNMSPAEVKMMRASVLRLMRTGSTDEELLHGYMRASNFGYKGKDADTILEIANKLGIGTHAPVDETSEAIAGLMNAYGHLPAKNARGFGNVMHAGAIASNMNLTQFERNSQRTFGLAANYGVLPEDAVAAYAALVQHRLSPGRSDTQIAGMLQQIAAPSPKALKKANELGLGDVFNRTGLDEQSGGIGLHGIIARVQSAISGLPKNEQAEALRALFNNKQGGIGAQFLIGKSSESYKSILTGATGTRAAASGKVDFTENLYQQQMGQAVQQWKALAGTIKSDFLPVGEKMLPVLDKLTPILGKLADVLSKLLDGFSKLPEPVQQFVLAVGGLKILNKVLETFTGISIVLPKIGPLLRTVAQAAGMAKGGFGGLSGSLGILSLDLWAGSQKSADMSGALNRLGTTAQTAMNAFKIVFNTFKPIVSNAVTAVITTLRGFGAQMLAAGAALWAAFVAGVRSKLDDAKQAVLGGLRQIENLLPHSDAKEGPLSHLSASGEAIPATLAAGVKKGGYKLTDSVRDMMSEADQALAIRSRYRVLRSHTKDRGEQANLGIREDRELTHLHNHFRGRRGERQAEAAAKSYYAHMLAAMQAANRAIDAAAARARKKHEDAIKADNRALGIGPAGELMDKPDAGMYGGEGAFIDAKRQTTRQSLTHMAAEFKNGKLSLDQYIKLLQTMQADLLNFASINPDEAKIKQAILPLVTVIQDAVDKATEKGIRDAAKRAEIFKQFWGAFAAPVEQALDTMITGALTRSGQHIKGKDLFRQMATDMVGTVVSTLMHKASEGLGNLVMGGLFGAKGKGNPLDAILGAGKGKGLFSSVPGLFKDAKGSLLEGAAGIYGAAMALGAGGKKKQRHSLLGAALGFGIGGFLGGVGAIKGAEFGSMLGGMFATGGMPPVGLPSLVNDNEVFRPNVPGTIIPLGNRAAQALQSAGVGTGGGPSMVHIDNSQHFHGAVHEASDVRQLQRANNLRSDKTVRMYGSIPATN